MLAVALFIGLAAAWPPAPVAWLLASAMGFLFMSRDAAASAALRLSDGKKTPEGFIGRRLLWSLLYVGVAALLLVTAWSLAAPEAHGRLLAVTAVTLLLGGAHVGLAFADRDRTAPGVVLGMAALASTVPLIVAAGRPLDRRAIGAGLACLLYFATTLAYVKAVRGLWKGDRAPLRRCLGAHAAIAGALATLLSGGFVTPLFAGAFVPVYARTAWGVRRPPAGLRVLGWREVGVAALFALIAAVSFAFPA